jgi:hypothetical protein
VGSIPAILDINSLKKYTKFTSAYLKLRARKNVSKKILKTKFFFKNVINFKKYSFFKSNYSSSVSKLNLLSLESRKAKFNKYIIYVLYNLGQKITTTKADYIEIIDNMHPTKSIFFFKNAIFTKPFINLRYQTLSRKNYAYVGLMINRYLTQ